MKNPKLPMGAVVSLCSVKVALSSHLRFSKLPFSWMPPLASSLVLRFIMASDR
jgi:hypothetical protein